MRFQLFPYREWTTSTQPLSLLVRVGYSANKPHTSTLPVVNARRQARLDTPTAAASIKSDLQRIRKGLHVAKFLAFLKTGIETIFLTLPLAADTQAKTDETSQDREHGT